jgi:hypothetical protein
LYYAGSNPEETAMAQQEPEREWVGDPRKTLVAHQRGARRRGVHQRLSGAGQAEVVGPAQLLSALPVDTTSF